MRREAPRSCAMVRNRLRIRAARENARLMAGAKLEKTRWPGIYRRGDRWAYEWTDAAGKRRRGSASTREDASARKAEEEANAAAGTFGASAGRSRLTLAAYALDLYGADV